MAQRRLAIASKELSLRVVGSFDSFFATRIQRLAINTDIPTTMVDELGNSQHAGVITDVPNITLTFSAFDVSVKIFAVLTGTDPDTYPALGVDVEELQEVDAIIYIKDADTADYVKACHARRLQIRDFSFNYSVDGESTEEYTAIGSEKRWFKNDVIVDRFTSGTTSFTLSKTPVQLKNGNYALTVILDGDYLTEVSTAPDVTGEYRVVATTLTIFDTRTDKVISVYQAALLAADEWTDVGDAGIPVAIRGKNVEILIGVNSIERVQSVTINGNLNVQPVREMNNVNIVGYQRQVPTVEGTVTVLDTDTELLDLLVNTGPTSDTEWALEGECTVSGLALEVKLYDPCDPTTVVKTVYIPTFRVVGDSYTSNVNENAVQTFNWQSEDAQCIVYSGAK